MASGLLVRGTLPRDEAVLTRSQPGAQYCTAAAHQPVCAGECHMWIGTPCSNPNHAKSSTCQRLSCVKHNTLPRDSLHHFLYWSSEDFWNRSIQGGTANYAVSLSAMASWIWKARRSSLRVGAMHQVARLVRFSQPRAHVSLFSPPPLLLESHKKGLGPTASDRWKLLTF